METPSTFATGAFEDAGNRLQLPQHAWPRRRLVDASLPLKVAAISLGLAGLFELAMAFGLSSLMDSAKWFFIVQALALFGLAAGAWRAEAGFFRRSLAVALLAQGMVRIALMIASEGRGVSWIGASTTVAWFALGVGMWQARDWARWMAVVVGFTLYGVLLFLAVVGIQIVHRTTSDNPLRPIAWHTMTLVGAAVILSPLVGLAIYGLLPQTRKHFADVRRARLRARPVTG